jgi:hypothetical protein
MYYLRQSSNFFCASAFRHSARNRPLNASMKALSVGLPGREKSERDVTLVSPQIQIARDKLSALVDPDRAGNQISRPTLSRTSTTLVPRKVKRGSRASEKHEKVSTVVSVRSLRPVASGSRTKSIAQVSFGRVALRRCSRSSP